MRGGQDMSSPLIVTATISGTGQLTVYGLTPTPQVHDEVAPGPARNLLVNLLHDAAAARGQVVAAAARTPAGPWYFGVNADGSTAPVDPEAFAGVELPDLPGEVVLAGAAAVFAAAAASPPAAMLALASDPDPAIRAEALAELRSWPDDPTPVADAELPPDRLDRLSRCPLPWVAVGVAANPATRHATLGQLIATGDPAVQAAVAARFDLDAEYIVLLAAVDHPQVRAALARNPSAAFLPHAPAPAPTEPAPAPTEPAPVAPALAVAGPGTTALAPAPIPAHTDDPRPVPAVAGGGAAGALDPEQPIPVPARRSGRIVAAGLAGVVLLGGGYAITRVLAEDPAAASAEAQPAGPVAMWNGMALPAGPDGPADPGGDTARGFAHTQLGAAMAAAHLSVRIDPYAGPASFEPTITTQTHGGDPAALLAATQARYTAAGGDGGPIPTSTGQITGWRAEDWTPETPTPVHLRVTSPDGTATDYGITVVWADGDYHLLDPTRDDTFTTAPAQPAENYRSFG